MRENEEFGNIRIIDGMVLKCRRGETPRDRNIFFIEMNGSTIWSNDLLDCYNPDDITEHLNNLINSAFAEIVYFTLKHLEDKSDNIPIKPIKKFIDKQIRIMIMKRSEKLYSTNINIGRSWYKLNVYDAIGKDRDELHRNPTYEYDDVFKVQESYRLAFIEDTFIGTISRKSIYGDEVNRILVDKKRILVSNIIKYLMKYCDGRLSIDKYKSICSVIEGLNPYHSLDKELIDNDH